MQDLNILQHIGNNKILGGTNLLLSADFQQIISVILLSTLVDEINACFLLHMFCINNYSYGEFTHLLHI